MITYGNMVFVVTIFILCFPHYFNYFPYIHIILYYSSYTLTTCMCAKLLQSFLTLWDPMDCSRQAPLSMGFSGQEYWSGLPSPPLGELSWSRDRTGISYVSCIEGRFFTGWAIWEVTHLAYLDFKVILVFKIVMSRTSLVIQWLRLCPCNAEGTSLMPAEGTRIIQAVWCDLKKKKLLCLYSFFSSCPFLIYLYLIHFHKTISGIILYYFFFLRIIFYCYIWWKVLLRFRAMGWESWFGTQGTLDFFRYCRSPQVIWICTDYKRIRMWNL